MSNQHVFEHAHADKYAQKLKRARYASTRDLVCLAGRDVFTVE